MSVVEIMVTGPKDDIERIAGHLLGSRLVACAQMWSIHSRYWWQGELEEADEIRMAAHTRRELADRVSACVRQLHPYDVPCVLVIPVDTGNQSYESWVYVNTEDLGNGTGQK